MFTRREVKVVDQEQNPQRQSDQSRGGDSSNRDRNSTFLRQSRTKTAESSKIAETPTSDKVLGKQRDNSRMSGALLSKEQSTAVKDFNPTEGKSTFSDSKHARRSSVSSIDSGLGDYAVELRGGVSLLRPKPPKAPVRKDSGYESAGDHVATELSSASSWGKEMTAKDLTFLTNQELNNKEARLEANVEKGIDFRARYKAKQEIAEIHEQKRKNKREYFKGGLRKTYKELVEAMVTVVYEDVQTTKEPKVHSKILKTEEASRITAQKRDKSQEECTTHNVYAKLNALSIFRRAQEQSLSVQPEFSAIEKAVYRKKVDAVRDGLRDIRKRFDAVEQSHLWAHGIVDIEKGTITLNEGNTVIKLHEIQGITTGPITTDGSHREPSTHGSEEKSWTLELPVGKEAEQTVDGKTTKSVTVKNSSTKAFLTTQHLVNFQTGRIELANGTMIDLKDIDWTENKAEEPTRLRLKQSSPLYRDGSTLDLKEASKSLDAAAMANRQKYEQALKQYRLAQMAMLEKVAYAGSSSLSDMHALLAGMRTNDSSVVQVQDDIYHLKRVKDSVTAYHFKEAVRRIGNDATGYLLHVRQESLNNASTTFARALKSSALADISKEKGSFGKFGETETVKTIKGTHEGPTKGIELQNDTDLPKYDKQKAREDEFNAQTATLNAQREDLATRLEASNTKASSLDERQKGLLAEAADLKKEAADSTNEATSKRQDAIKARLGAIEKELMTTVWNQPDWSERAKIHDEHNESVARCEEQEQKKKDFDALEKKLATSKSQFTRNSYHIRKIAEADALGQLDNVEKYVKALERVHVEPGDNNLVKARKEYENARVDHIVEAHRDAKEKNNPNKLRMALYEERYHASIVRYNISRAQYALENNVSEIVKDSEGNERQALVSIDRLKSVRTMHLVDIITDSNTLSTEQEVAQRQSQHSYDETMYRVKPATFVPKPSTEETAVENAAEFSIYARERARYEVQKLIDKTADANDKAKMIDSRGDLEKDFVERFTKSYGEDRARAHEVQRVKLARKAMNDFAWKMFGMALVSNFQMAHNSFDQGIDSTLSSIIRSGTRTA